MPNWKLNETGQHAGGQRVPALFFICSSPKRNIAPHQVQGVTPCVGLGQMLLQELDAFLDRRLLLVLREALLLEPARVQLLVHPPPQPLQLTFQLHPAGRCDQRPGSQRFSSMDVPTRDLHGLMCQSGNGVDQRFQGEVLLGDRAQRLPRGHIHEAHGHDQPTPDLPDAAYHQLRGRQQPPDLQLATLVRALRVRKLNMLQDCFSLLPVD